MDKSNWLFRLVNSRGKVTTETRLYGVTRATVLGMLLGLTYGAHTPGSKHMPYAVAYAYDDGGNITDCDDINRPPRNYYHPTNINTL